MSEVQAEQLPDRAAPVRMAKLELHACICARSPESAVKRRSNRSIREVHADCPDRLLRPMDVNELMKKAWHSVEQAGIPEALQGEAFKEAVAYLRAAEEQEGADGKGGAPESTTQLSKPRKQSGKRGGSRPGGRAQKKENETKNLPDRDSFFATLARESGIDEQVLKDVLQFTDEGDIHVLPPTKDLGKSKAAQARTVIALVAGARAHGLGEDPVDDAPVRAAMKNKRCYDKTNFSFHLRPLKGFNSNPSGGLVLSSKWVSDFATAIAVSTGTEPES